MRSLLIDLRRRQTDRCHLYMLRFADAVPKRPLGSTKPAPLYAAPGGQWSVGPEICDAHCPMGGAARGGFDKPTRTNGRCRVRQPPTSSASIARGTSLKFATGYWGLHHSLTRALLTSFCSRDSVQHGVRDAFASCGNAPGPINGDWRQKAPPRTFPCRAERCRAAAYSAGTPAPIGHDTPVPPSPQYPLGFFAKYC